MPIDSFNRNYERNRDNRGRRRRLKAANVESLHENLTKSFANSRKSRIDMPARSAKSLNNLSCVEMDGGADQGNSTNQNAPLTPLNRIIKWYKHISATRETQPQTNLSKATPPEQTLSPPRYQQTGYVGKKRGFMGPLGLGEFVESMGGGFDDADLANGSPHAQQKSRSLIDISMSNLWGNEDDENIENDGDNNDHDISAEKFRKALPVQPSRSSLLNTISRLVPIPPTAPNLVQFLDNPSVSGNVYENMETTFFGNTEDRWSTPAFVVSACSQMLKGDLFNVHCIADYLAELKLTANWANSVKCLCEGELRKYKSAGRGKRQKRLPNQGSKSENETELKELCADFTTFFDMLDAFRSRMKDEYRGLPISAILIAGHNERLFSMKNVLPAVMPTAQSGNQKAIPLSAYRKFLSEISATAVLNYFSRSADAPCEVSAFLCSDSLLIASKCCEFKHFTASSSLGNGSSSKSGSRCSTGVPPTPFHRPSGVFETLVRLPLTFLGLSAPNIAFCLSTSSPQNELIVPVVKITPPLPQGLCSSSSGVSSSASTEEEMEGVNENRSSGCGAGTEEFANGLDLWWPPGNKCQLVLNGDRKSCQIWRSYLQTNLEQIQSCFANQTLGMKVLNEIAPEKCVHKYIALGQSITTKELKEKALSAMNIGPMDAEIVASFADPKHGNMELPLSDEDRPFLLALYVTTLLSGEKSPDESVDFFGVDQTDQSLSPRNLTFPLPPDRIPVSFIIRESPHDEKNSSTPSRVFAEADILESLKNLVDRPKSIMYAEMGHGYRPHFRGISQSSHNLSATGATSNISGKGRSRSRLRLQFFRGNAAYAGDDDADDKDQITHSGIFGRLPKEAWPDCRVSMSVMSLFVVIFYKGSLTEGIFRKSVQLSQLQAMIHRVDTDEDPLMADECSPLCAANILKKYFSEIPGHLLIDEKWDEWCKLTTFKTDEEIANYAKKILRELPDINQSLLTFLLFTLAQIRVNSFVNKMSVEALSTVWGPNLLERPNAAPSVEDSTICASIIACLLGPFTNTCVLSESGTEFRQKLSAFFDEIWGQMIPHQSTGEAVLKPPPEGISILEFPETKIEESLPSESPSVASTRSLEPLQAKDKRNALVHSHSVTEKADSGITFKRHLKTIRKDSKSSSSQESADLPPPIPPRNRRKSTSSYPLTPGPIGCANPSLIDSAIPPPLPARTYISPQHSFFSPREQRKKYNLNPKDTNLVTGTAVIDRRRSFSRRRNPYRSPIRSCTLEMDSSPHDQQAFMIGDISDDFDSLSFMESPENKPQSAEATSIQRSTSDVDANLLNKQLTIHRKPQKLADFPPFLEYETNPGGAYFPWQTIAARRTSSRNHRCETRWTCGYYETPSLDTPLASTNEKIEDLCSTPRRIQPDAVAELRPSAIRQRPTAIYLDENAFFPDFQKTSPASEVPAGICRHISSIYEQKKLQSNDVGWRNLPLRNSLTGADQLNSTSSAGTHLSRGSSHASTGSSTSTTLGPN
ncbi:hypothetical protein Aperf_G00000117880 [Anoplocephala perfoliata]